jgi:hypothetical protein
VTLTRGSRARLRAFWRPAAVENSTASPSRAIQTTEVWGPPSAFSVATVAKLRPSSSSRISGLNGTAPCGIAGALVVAQVTDGSR